MILLPRALPITGASLLSYRHGFHAGNHADVLKHWVLNEVLEALRLKEKAFWVIDTHAGAGLYDLHGEHALRTNEAQSGILRLLSQDLPPSLSRYLEKIQSFNQGEALRFYPGSPLIAARSLRSEDRLRLCELHSTDHAILSEHLAPYKNSALLQKLDGFKALRSFLPPPSRRGLILMDPPYELSEDCENVVASLADALRRFATGVYMLWYPILSRRDVQVLPERVRALCPKSLDLSLTVRAPAADGFGLHGSGLVILNPPYTILQALREEGPSLSRILEAEPGQGSFEMNCTAL